ncbi:MAG: PEP-CTERM sorting domain-containing protein [Pseudomonadota bacterium]
MKSRMTVLKSLSLAGLLFSVQAAKADITVFTDQAAYMAAVGDTGTDSFDNLPYMSTGPIQRSAGAHGYTVGSAAGAGSPYLFAGGNGVDNWLSANRSQDTLVFSQFSSQIRGIGGEFFNTAGTGGLIDSGSITLTATEADGHTVSYALLNPGVHAFLGFVSTGRLRHLSVRSPFQDGLLAFPTVNNLQLSLAAVPEPDTYAMLLAGLAMLGAIARRRRRPA